MDAAKRKDLKDAYRSQTPVGGVYRIRCAGNRRTWVRATRNVAGLQNKFAFSVSIGSCPEPGMRGEWAEYGPQSFSLTVLETLEKKDTQTEREFAEDIAALLDLWNEKNRLDAAD
ncbi:MAG: GIY-YIG nuclease family protein [Clostridiales bacterium]|nr:GIY-YIG nuclease family protein [Clostridiales bacterium]